MNEPSRHPQTLFVVRHGESAANIARTEANAMQATHIDTRFRDMDVPLSALGERQAAALGHWFASLPADQRPTVVFSSPYLRARQTTDILKSLGGFKYANRFAANLQDERFREREFGILDGLTKYGIKARFPEQHALRHMLGKFYHRPPGGENWCDVILRLRSAFDMLCREFPGERVLIVAHSVVVLCMRYVIEGLTESEILEIDRNVEVANCSVTRFDASPGAPLSTGMALDSFNFVAPLLHEGTTVTSAPDYPA